MGDFFMNKLYLLAIIFVVVFMAYFYGANTADAKCRLRAAQASFNAVQTYQNQIVKTKRITHDTTYKMGVDDIRRVLRDKYTIGE